MACFLFIPFLFIYIPQDIFSNALKLLFCKKEKGKEQIRKRGTKEAGKKGGGGRKGGGEGGEGRGRKRGGKEGEGRGKGGKGSTNDRKCVCGSKGEDQGRGGLDRLHWQRRASNRIKTQGLVAIEAGNTLLVWQ